MSETLAWNVGEVISVAESTWKKLEKFFFFFLPVSPTVYRKRLGLSSAIEGLGAGMPVTCWFIQVTSVV